MMPNGSTLTRRVALLGLPAAFALGNASLALAAAPTQHRFVVVILRGAMDGLAAVQPYGDPAFAGLRGPLALPQPGTPGGLLDLGGFYGLHPSLATFHMMFRGGEALPVHAVAGSYRSRSHFEAQDYLESGAEQRLSSGWLNRAVAAIPGARTDDALSIGLATPLLLRGPAPVESWAPDHFASPDPALYAHLAALSAADPVLGPAFAAGLRERRLAPGVPAGRKPGDFATLAEAAGRMLAAPDGPRVAALELGGWDTHAGQNRRLAAQLAGLDAGFAALQSGLGDAWARTLVLCVTEFGRTARVNGTNGTDHGTGGVALLVGGAVAGGSVRADWPGLGAGRLLEDRDLQPTAELRCLAAACLVDHLGVPARRLGKIFPEGRVAPMRGIVRA